MKSGLLPIIDHAGELPGEQQTDPEYSRGRYAFVSLGCPKNLVDSEKMLGSLALDGYTLVSETGRSRLCDREHVRIHRKFSR